MVKQSLTTGTSGLSREACSVLGEVGAVHSSVEMANHHGAKGPYLVDVNSEARERRWL